MTFFTAPPSSTPLRSVLVYTRKVGLVKIFCTAPAAAISVLAATMRVGMSRATSSAWVGPDSATTRACLPTFCTSSSMTSDMVASVFSSTPLATSTMICPSGRHLAAFLAVARTNGDGTANTSRSRVLQASAMSAV